MSNSPKTPAEKLEVAYRATFALGFLMLFLGGFFIFVSTSLRKPSDADLTLIGGVIAILIGILYLVLGFFVKRKSSVALGIAIGFMALNFLFAIFNLIKTGGNFAGFIFPVLYISQSWEGFKAIEDLKKAKKP